MLNKSLFQHFDYNTETKCDTTDQVLYIYSENSISVQNLYHKSSRFQILYQIIHILRLVFMKTSLCVCQYLRIILNLCLAQKMALNRTNCYTNVWCTEICRYDRREAQCLLYSLNKSNTVPSTQINVPKEQRCRCGNTLIKPTVATNNLCLAYTCRTP